MQKVLLELNLAPTETIEEAQAQIKALLELHPELKDEVNRVIVNVCDNHKIQKNENYSISS